MTHDVARLLEMPPFSLTQREKDEYFSEAIWELTNYHRQNCPPYHNMLEAMNLHVKKSSRTQDVPFLPSGVFKAMALASQPQGEYSRILTSSGTTGSKTVQVQLNRETAADQQRALTHIAADFIGNARRPMLIIDRPSVLKGENGLSARAAGILGFAVFGRKRVFALKEDMSLNLPAILEFLEAYGSAPFLLFGFTFCVWQYFYQVLSALPEALDFSQGVLIHGGGWKKLAHLAVSPQEFSESLRQACGLNHIYNYYGMAEQTGSVFMQCEHGRFHASHFSEVFVRRGSDFSLCRQGEPGILQVLSLLPRSYPGHSILTEDEGIFLGVDDCPCGRMGRTFSVLGRLAQAEARGCSDVYAV